MFLSNVEEAITVVIYCKLENHTLEYALGEAGLSVSKQRGLLRYCPTDDAFDALPEGTLDAVLVLNY